MGVTYDTTEKKFIFDFEHDGVEDIGLAIRNAVDSAHKIINLYKYDVVVMPDNRTKENMYMIRYIYRFNQPMLIRVEELKAMDEELCSKIRQQNVLIIEDATTSGSTQNEVLRILRTQNEDNTISIFHLIKK